MATASAQIDQGSVTGSPTRQAVVVVQGLNKTFKDFWLRTRAKAVDNLTFHVEKGEVFGLLGPNGSGKSTSIKVILGLLKPTSGRVAVFGKPPTDVAIKKRIGYLPEESYLYPFLNARETLDYYGKLFQLDRDTRLKRIDELLDMVGLTSVQHRAVKEYSKGMQRRIGIAQALINDPELLILDEPTTGLDPIGTRQIKDLIIELGRRGKSIILSSHLLADVEDCVHRMTILYGGKKQKEGTCDQLLETAERSVIETENLDDETIRQIDELIRRRTGGAMGIEKVSHPRQKLEDLFVDIVNRATAERTETSGARHGGQTAEFLRSAPAEGEALLESLVKAESEPAAAVPVAPAVAVKPKTGPDDDVLSKLSTSSPAAAPAPQAPKAAEPGVAKPLDRGLLDSLSGDDKP
ncbi:MAG: ABC transporter ATP-binding protein [Phycisphaerales bacterium]